MNLILAKEFPPQMGGIAQTSYGISKAFNELGEETCVLTWHFKDDEEFDKKQPFIIFRLKRWGFLHPQLIEMFFFSIYLIKKFKITKIYATNWNHTGLIACLLKKILKLPYYTFVHGDEIILDNLCWRDKRYMYFTLNNANKIFAVSRYTRQRLIELGILESKCIFMPNAVDQKRFNRRINSTELKTKLGLLNKKIILSVSRLVEMKGIDMIIRSMPAVIKTVPEVCYLIVGKGEEENSLKKLVKDLQLDKYVKLIGFISNELLPLYYNLCDVFIIVSRELHSKKEHSIEGFGIAYLEASACAKPVIAGNSGGVKDAVIDGVTGILINPTDINGIPSALIRLLTDTEFAKRLGNNGRRRVEEELNWKNITRKIIEITNKE